MSERLPAACGSIAAKRPFGCFPRFLPRQWAGKRRLGRLHRSSLDCAIARSPATMQRGQEGLNAVVCEQEYAFWTVGEQVVRLEEGSAPQGRSDVSRQGRQGQPMSGSTSDRQLDRLVKA